MENRAVQQPGSKADPHKELYHMHEESEGKPSMLCSAISFSKVHKTEGILQLIQDHSTLYAITSQNQWRFGNLNVVKVAKLLQILNFK